MTVNVPIPSNQAAALRDVWEEKVVALRAEADELEQAIAAIDAQINASIPSAWKNPSEPERKGKRKKGENLRTVQAFLEAMATKGSTVAEISKATGLPITSCNAVLKRHGDIFAKGSDSLWRRKPTQNAIN